MSISLDVGTMFLVKGEIDDLVNGASFTSERNVFLQAATTEDTEEVLKENNWSYVKYNNQYYILGEDAIKLKNLLTLKSTDENILMTKIGELRRPMKDGILNTGEEKLSVAIIQKLIANLIGKPKYPGEQLCFCAPGNPVDSNLSVIFHQTMLSNFLTSLGFTVECIPEAVAIIYSENPTADDPTEENGKAQFSGISISSGAGMCNVALVWKKIPLINFSICKSGDWIDRETAKTTGLDVSTITRFKEKSLNLDKIDFSDMKQAALSIYYEQMILHAVKNLAEKFNQLQTEIESPLEIVIAGGTASVPGFLNKFKTVIESQELPFKIKDIRMAANPLYAVSNGCLLKSISLEQKKTKEK